jgi:Polyketide cyclase / dehydrase and lipid transport
MSFSTCPIATVDAPVERVWSLLAHPAYYARWWDAETRSVTPEGPARPGQKIYAQARGLGRLWDVRIEVGQVDAANHQLELTTRLPLGITVRNHISCTPLDGRSCRVTFG